MSGLGHEFSDGIIYGLANRLMRMEGVSVRTGSFSEYDLMAAEARALPEHVDILQVGHSLGASVAAEWARRVKRIIACIYGFDPANNLAANAGQYKLTKVPANVRKAVDWTIPGFGLGGGVYEAENTSATVTESIIVPYSHTNLEESIEEHLRIAALARRLVAGA
jgi:pimeloyl-ACP methyl ester carboxylesterase